jgi:hypothetical protein
VSRSIPIELAGRGVQIADPHDLIAMKLRAHRLKDDYDIAQIAGATRIDRVKLETLVTGEEMAVFHEIMKRV